jgi:hypothetical protein
MARLLHHGDCGCGDDFDDSSGSCSSGRHDRDCSGHSGRRHKQRKHDRLIPVGNITLDCSVVAFKTPGQARNVVTCPVFQVVTVPVSPTTFAQVPVLTTVDQPPLLVPFPRIVCPSGILTADF